MRLEGKVALVTGSGQGIGRSIALTFAREGADIIVNDINLDVARRTVGEVKALGRRAIALKADVSISAEVNEMVEQAIKEFGRIDILVNNAGIAKFVPAEEFPEADWDKIIDVNLKGPFLCSQAVGKHMIKQKKGKIVNIVSVSGHRGRPLAVAYCSSKGGVIQLTQTLAVEWAKYNINVNSVTPCLTETPLARKQTIVDMEKRAKKVPLGRFNKPEDIANAVLFLASSESDNIAGQDIIVDGGLCALHPGYLSQLE